jgi:hypothetical protein
MQLWKNQIQAYFLDCRWGGTGSPVGGTSCRSFGGMGCHLRRARMACKLCLVIFHAYQQADTHVRVNDMIKSFLNLYASDTPKWDNIQEMVDALDFSSVINQTASDYLSSRGVHSNWINEVVEATTRVNYGQVSNPLYPGSDPDCWSQNIDTIHGMGGMVSMAANGAFGVQGGNFQIFQQFIKFSNAKLHLKTKVISEMDRIHQRNPVANVYVFRLRNWNAFPLSGLLTHQKESKSMTASSLQLL